MIARAQRPDGPTRGQVIALLRRGPMTVDELASAIGVTDNAVRLHLTALERDGIVRNEGVRREGSVGKPATLYAITPEGQVALSKAYEPVLSTLLVSLAGRLQGRELTELLRDVGRQLGSSATSNKETLEQRVEAAAALLESLGAEIEVEPAPGATGGYLVRGFACPLSRSVAQCPPLCAAVEEMVAGVTRGKVQERCDRTGLPRCSFLVTPRGTRTKA
ncbi:MAG TPA: helix-turn-helix domain-containing protein [Gemmatimonadaceae bacterium]|nr:helix-turn-helix domain-containing protein [Gemmatimonadaceae bacterium]